jgi:hypothetical protein
MAARLQVADVGGCAKAVHRYRRAVRERAAGGVAYASRHGYTLIDREVYLPQCWSDDAALCAAAGIPEHVRFAVKIALDRRMLTRAARSPPPSLIDAALSAVSWLGPPVHRLAKSRLLRARGRRLVKQVAYRRLSSMNADPR